MTEYKLFTESMYDRIVGFYKTYGISVFEDGKLTRIIKDISLDRDAVERLICAFNDEKIEAVHLSQAIDEFLYECK